MSPLPDAVEAVRLLGSLGHTVATAESLTGGLLCAALVDVPGASEVVLGGVVAYAPRLKAELLHVSPQHLAIHGTVDGGTAEQMASGARRATGASWGLSTTGVAGPDPSEGKPVGTVHVGIASPDGGVSSTLLHLQGGRREIRDLTVAAALSLLVARVGEEGTAPRR